MDMAEAVSVPTWVQADRKRWWDRQAQAQAVSSRPARAASTAGKTPFMTHGSVQYFWDDAPAPFFWNGAPMPGVRQLKEQMGEALGAGLGA